MMNYNSGYDDIRGPVGDIGPCGNTGVIGVAGPVGEPIFKFKNLTLSTVHDDMIKFQESNASKIQELEAKMDLMADRLNMICDWISLTSQKS